MTVHARVCRIFGAALGALEWWTVFTDGLGIQLSPLTIQRAKTHARTQVLQIEIYMFTQAKSKGVIRSGGREDPATKLVEPGLRS